MNKLFLLLFSLFSFTKTDGQPIQKEGIMNLVTPSDPEGLHHYTRFMDSVVIFEIYEQWSESEGDSITAEGVRIFKYSILDLTNMRAQDYITFSDTATPVTNYQLKNSESISFGFHLDKHPYGKYIDSLVPMPDSMINGKQYKRLYFDLSGSGWHQRLVYYFEHQESRNIFHMMKPFDSCYPGYKITRVQYIDMLTGHSSFSYLELVSNTLNVVEHNVFEAWQKNLSTSTLPITSKIEAQSSFARLNQKK